MFKNEGIFNFYNTLLAVFLITAAYFRFTFLGFSDLQGDEAKLFEFRNADTLWGFLLQNSKGPGQYLIVEFLKHLSFEAIDIEFLYRLPFALAGFFSVCLFYLISKNFFDFKIGLNVLLIAVLNGFFIAFSRIIQYQSFEILFALTSSLFFLNFLRGNNRKDLFFSSIFSAVAILFHYDAVSFIIPQLILLFLTKDRTKNCLFYFLGLSASLVFYVPYVLSESFLLTFKYLIYDRAASNFSYDSVLYSLKLSTVYLSKEYLIIVIFAVILAFWNLKIKGFYRVTIVMLIMAVISRYFVGHPYKPLILISNILSFLIFLPVFFNKEISLTKKYFYIWFLVAFTIYILALNKPLTHIYNIFIPMTFLAGYQLNKIRSKILRYGVLQILFLSASSFNYCAYIENKVEYPWESEKYIFGNMYEGISEGEIVRGIFGFPYYRSLDNLDRDLSLVIDKNTTPIFLTNIKPSRLAFYLKDEYPPNLPYSRYYIEIKNDRDYEVLNPSIIGAQKLKLIETQNYSIYKIL